LLLHVADASNPEVFDQISAVYKVLQELHIEEKDTLLILNKIDRVEDRSELARVFTRYPNAVPISAATGEGLRNLQNAVSDALSRSFADLDVETSAGDGRLFAFLAAHGEVLERTYTDDDRVIIHCRLPQRHRGALQQEGVVVRNHRETFPTEEAGETRPVAIDSIEEVA
jgi:GTP-binding protein HflX